MSAGPMCPCPALPVAVWRTSGGRWEVHGSVAGDPIADAEAYLAGGYVAWVVSCPACHRVYAVGWDYG